MVLCFERRLANSWAWRLWKPSLLGSSWATCYVPKASIQILSLPQLLSRIYPYMYPWLLLYVTYTLRFFIIVLCSLCCFFGFWLPNSPRFWAGRGLLLDLHIVRQGPPPPCTGRSNVILLFHIRAGPKSPFSLPAAHRQPDVYPQQDFINTLSPSIAWTRSGFTHFLRFVELVFMIKVSYLEALGQAGDVLSCEELEILGIRTAGPSGWPITRRGNEITQVRKVSPWLSSLSLVIDAHCLLETWSHASKCLSGTWIEPLMAHWGEVSFRSHDAVKWFKPLLETSGWELGFHLPISRFYMNHRILTLKCL